MKKLREVKLFIASLWIANHDDIIGFLSIAFPLLYVMFIM